MKKRRNANDLSSFELLLDTMCNTFGGIVFIALLITLLSQSIEINPESDSHQNTQVDTHKNTQSDISPETLIKKIEQIKRNISLKEQRDQLEKELRENLQRIASAKKNIKTFEKEVEIINQRIAESEKLHNQERELRLPKLHLIDKSPVFIAIRHGRFYAITNISYSITNLSSEKWGARVRGYDNTDILIREYKNEATIELLSGRGQIISKGAEKGGKLQQAISNINPAKEFIVFAVYPDSFAEFNYVKEIFINRGFDYNWFIIKDQLALVKGAGQLHAQ